MVCAFNQSYLSSLGQSYAITVEKARELLSMGVLRSLDRSKSVDDGAKGGFETTRQLLSLPPGSTIGFASGTKSNAPKRMATMPAADVDPTGSQHIRQLLSVDGRLVLSGKCKPNSVTRTISPTTPVAEAIPRPPAHKLSPGQSLIKRLQTSAPRQLVTHLTPKDSHAKRTISVVLNSSTAAPPSHSVTVPAVASRKALVITPQTMNQRRHTTDVSRLVPVSISFDSGRKAPLVSKGIILQERAVGGLIDSTVTNISANKSSTTTEKYLIAPSVVDDKLLNTVHPPSTCGRSPADSAAAHLKLENRVANSLPSPPALSTTLPKQQIRRIPIIVDDCNKTTVTATDQKLLNSELHKLPAVIKPKISNSIASETVPVTDSNTATKVLPAKMVKDVTISPSSALPSIKSTFAEADVQGEDVKVQKLSPVMASLQSDVQADAPDNVDKLLHTKIDKDDKDRPGIDCVDTQTFEVLSPDASSTLSAHSTQGYHEPDAMLQLGHGSSILLPSTSILNPETGGEPE